MDGLLLDTERLFQQALVASAAGTGFPVDDAFVLRMVGLHRDACRILLTDTFGADFPLDAFYEESEWRFAESCAAGIPLRPGVVALLDHLAAMGIPHAVATSSPTPQAQDHLREAGLLDRFATIVTRSDVANPKPAPDPYLLAAERLGARPAHCLALEDSHNGVRAAAAAGMAVIMVPDLLAPTDETDGLVRCTLPGLDHVLVELERDAAA